MHVVVEILKSARDRVKKGWVQGAAENDAGTRVCAAQAIAYGAQEQTVGQTEMNGLATIANELLLAAIEERFGLPWISIPQWNDQIDRTQDDVVDTFDHAIKLAERDLEGAAG